MKKFTLYNSSGRIEYIDLARGIAIYAVLIGHISLIHDSPFNGSTSILQNIVYAFHIPVFFFISGMCFSDKVTSFKSFLLKRIRGVLIPYISFSFIWLVYELATGMIIYNKSFTLHFIVSKAINYILQIRYMPLWFLTCLFIVSILFYLILWLSKGNNKIVLLLSLIITVIGIVYRLLIGKSLFWNVDLSFLMLIFTCAGYFFKQFDINKVRKSNLLFIAAGLFVLCQIINYINLRFFEPHSVDIMLNSFGCFPLFYLSSLLGSISVVLIAAVASKHFVLTKYIGQNSLIIYALHQIVFRICETLLSRYQLSSTLLYVIWFFIIIATIIVFTAITYFVNSTPLCIFIGKKYERKKHD